MSKEWPYLEKPQRMGQDRFVIWSMTFEWEPDGDPDGKPVPPHDKANVFGEYATLEEAQTALASLNARDESFYGEPEKGAEVLYWIWRETPMAEKRAVVE